MTSLPSSRTLRSSANLTTVPVTSRTSKLNFNQIRAQLNGKIDPKRTDPHKSAVDSLNVIDTKLSENEFTCDFIDCNLKFNHSSSLIRHLRIHSETLSCTVDGCEKVFVYERDLKRHLKRHSQTLSIVIKFRNKQTKSIVAAEPDDYRPTETDPNVELDFIESSNTKTDTIKKIEIDANHSNSAKVMSNCNRGTTTRRIQSNGWRKLIRKFIVLRKNLLSKDVARKNQQKKQKMNAQDSSQKIKTYSEGLKRSSESTKLDGFGENDNRVNQKETEDDQEELTSRSVKRTRTSHPITSNSTKKVITHTLQCPKCNFDFNNVSSLTRHTQIHFGTFKCTRNGCTKCFSSREHMWTHLKRHSTLPINPLTNLPNITVLRIC